MPIVPELSVIGNHNTHSLIRYQSEWDEVYAILIMSRSDIDEKQNDTTDTFRYPFLSA